MKEHHFHINIEWKSDQGTSSYTAYSRNHIMSLPEKYSEILCSSAPEFRGDKSKYNPEEMLISALSTCHMLWYLHLCADQGIIVKHYIDSAKGTMIMNEDGSGQFSEVTLKPIIQITDESKIELAYSLHQKAHHYCFIARSCNFPILHNPKISTKIPN